MILNDFEIPDFEIAADSIINDAFAGLESKYRRSVAQGSANLYISGFQIPYVNEFYAYQQYNQLSNYIALLNSHGPAAGQFAGFSGSLLASMLGSSF